MAGGVKKPIAQDIQEKAADFQDREIEYSLMAYLLRENPIIVSSVDKSWFSDFLLQDVFTVVEDLKIIMSKAMVMNELRDRQLMVKKETEIFSEALDQVYDVNLAPLTEKTVRHMMTQLLRLSESRKVLTACGNVIGSMKAFDLDAAKRTLATASREVALHDVENAVLYLDHYEHRKDIMEAKEEARDTAEDGTAGVKTGIYAFDRMTGGLMAKEFGLVAGITGVGKTAALIEFAVNAYENGYNVMIGSGEMSVDELAFRIDSRLTRIHGMKFRTAELEESDYQKWDDTIAHYRASKDNVLCLSSYPRKFTIADFERDMIRFQETTGKRIQVTCLDYVNILSPLTKSKSGGWQDQSEAIWDFKGFCASHNLVGWTAGQVIDDAYDKELYDASDLKYSRAISEATPVIIALIQTDKDRIESRMKLQVIKMRNATVPKHPLKLNPNLSIMRLHTELQQKTKTLVGMKGNTIEMERKSRRSKPKRTARSP